MGAVMAVQQWECTEDTERYPERVRRKASRYMYVNIFQRATCCVIPFTRNETQEQTNPWTGSTLVVRVLGDCSRDAVLTGCGV